MKTLIAQRDEAVEPEEVERLVAQLEAQHLLDTGRSRREIWTDVRARHQKVRWAHMRRVLEMSAKSVPIYRDKYAGIDVPSIETEADLVRLPTTVKADIKARYPDGFLPDGYDVQDMTISGAIVRGVSSGTSAGERLQTLHTREAWHKQMIAGAALNTKLFPYIEAQNATFTTMHCADPDLCVTHLIRMEDRVRGGTRLLLWPPRDPGAPTKPELQRFIFELRAHRNVWIDCNPTYMAAMCYALMDAGLEAPKMEVVTSGFEFLSDIHRRVLAKTFQCPVFDRFSASELGNYVAVECEQGHFHVNDAYYFAEVIRDGRQAKPGELGHLVLTTLHETLPMVRYDTNDLVVAADAEPCECGSVAMRIASFEGRLKDIVVAADGSPVTERAIDRALAKVDNLRFYTVTQTAVGVFEMKVVPAPGADVATVKRAAEDALVSVVGRATVTVDSGRTIYPENSGKFRFTRSEVPGIEALVSADLPKAAD